jgi:hypothetical protein
MEQLEAGLARTRQEAHELEDVLGTLRRFDDTYPG